MEDSHTFAKNVLLSHSSAEHPPFTLDTMSDSSAPLSAPLTPSPAPPAPTGPRPKMTNRGRTAVPIAASNSESTEVPEFEPFVAPGPRGFPPMTGEALHCYSNNQSRSKVTECSFSCGFCSAAINLKSSMSKRGSETFDPKVVVFVWFYISVGDTTNH